MQYASLLHTLITCCLLLSSVCASIPASSPAIEKTARDGLHTTAAGIERNISISLFVDLEEFSRIVDISYCVGTTGIQQPFSCASRCDEFPDFELVAEFNTGLLMSDSCGYIALDHGSKKQNKDRPGRIIVAFRGTYSIANTIVDLSTVPQEYLPYPGSPSNDTTSASGTRGTYQQVPSKWSPSYSPRAMETAAEAQGSSDDKDGTKCLNCTVHSGFWQSWQNTRPIILPHLVAAHAQFPEYELHLVGHSLGGAVAALAGLELDASGWNPSITTFGEPKIGNSELRQFIDKRFGLPYSNSTSARHRQDDTGGRYRRVTHIDDPVPLLPLQEWGYKPHAGEIYISKPSLQPSLLDLEFCDGDEDTECSAGSESSDTWLNSAIADMLQHAANTIAYQQDISIKAKEEIAEYELKKRWGIPIPSRYKMWQLFFAHRDYFWRLGLCVKGGDPSDWGRDKYRFPEPGESGLERPQ